jgi:glutaredoxin-related protein
MEKNKVLILFFMNSCPYCATAKAYTENIAGNKVQR